MISLLLQLSESANFQSLLWALDVRCLAATSPDGCVLNKRSKGCVGGNAATTLLLSAVGKALWKGVFTEGGACPCCLHTCPF